MTKTKKALIGICSLAFIAIVIIGSFYFGGYMNTNNLLGYSAFDEQDLKSNLTAYMTITDSDNNIIDGGCTAAGKEGMFILCNAEHSLSSPTVIRSGSVGASEPSIYNVTTFVSKGLTSLYKANLSGKMLTVEIQYYSTDSDGKQVLYYTVKMGKVLISTIDFKMQTTNSEDSEEYEDTVSLGFSYATIAWTYEPENNEVGYNVSTKTLS